MVFHIHHQGIASISPTERREKRLSSNYSPLYIYTRTTSDSTIRNLIHFYTSDRHNLMHPQRLYKTFKNKENFKKKHHQLEQTMLQNINFNIFTNEYARDVSKSIILHPYSYYHLKNSSYYKYYLGGFTKDNSKKLYHSTDGGRSESLFLDKPTYKPPKTKQFTIGNTDLIDQFITILCLEERSPLTLSYCVREGIFQPSMFSRLRPFQLPSGGKTDTLGPLQNVLYPSDTNDMFSPRDRQNGSTLINDHSKVGSQDQNITEYKTYQLEDQLGVESYHTLNKSEPLSTWPSNGSLLSTYTGVTKHVENLSSKTSAYVHEFNDPLWRTQWYAQDYRTRDGPVMDHNLVPVYRMGIAGASVRIAIVDDGVQHGHPDLKHNHLEGLSWDMCRDSAGANPDPAPAHANSHGTKCAGEIAMVADNGVCGVGVAYRAKFAGVKTIGPRSVEYMEGRSLIHRLDVFDIYSNSWGPPDDGLGMERLGRITATAISKGVTQGRNGKGSIYTFAGGNGKHEGDTCAADGMVNDPHVIAVAAAGQRGKAPYYSERCAAILCAAYSGGEPPDEKVTTVDLDGECSTSFSGTSAAVPIATGIIALVLDANSNLTYRDVMHLITMGSEVAPLANNERSWNQNGAGFWVSNDFGFGLLNAENMVRMALNWTTVPTKNTCTVTAKMKGPKLLSVGHDVIVDIETTACEGAAGEVVRILEQLEITSTVQFPCRGAISINITSPAGTETTLLEPRPRDKDDRGLVDWTIKSVHCWGEQPQGLWHVRFRANALPGVSSLKGLVKDVTLRLHGTSETPAHHRHLPRGYAAFRLPDGRTSHDHHR